MAAAIPASNPTSGPVATTASSLTNSERGPRNIPHLTFVEDLEAFMVDKTVESVIAALNEMHSKYRFMQTSLQGQKEALKEKVPEMRSALAVVQRRIKRRAAAQPSSEKAYFTLSETIHAKALIEDKDSVFLWLGADTLLEYKLDEAQALLEKNIATAETGLVQLSADLDFLRQQLTTAEVNIARVHNFGVSQKQQQQQQK